MCLVIAFISLALSYNFFIHDDHTAAIIALGVAIVFFILMIKNILRVKKLKEKEKKNDN